MANEVVEMMRIKARTQNISLSLDTSIDPNLLLLCNAIGFKLIISNLLSNAIKYSEEGGSVSVRAWTEAHQLMLVIEDHGIGMDEEQLQMLFRKYEKINQEKSGQDIDLFMVKRLVDSFGGSIGVTSSLNEGTTVTIMLPLSP